MKIHLSGPESKLLNSQIAITGSKSESNRLLLLKALYPNIAIENLSNSDDSKVMQKGLTIDKGIVDIHHAGTAMRFLTGYFASQKGLEVTLTGSQRMTERPIKVLVEALRILGAEIEYLQNEGFPPIRIRGKNLPKNRVSLPANISSQYISSLLLIAPKMTKGLELELIGTITSVPYIKMTLGLLNQIGITTSFDGNIITVAPKKSIDPIVVVVESDWSSASYFYSMVALSDVGSEIILSAYKKNSLQGDRVLSEIYGQLGVQTNFNGNEIKLQKIANSKPENFNLDLSDAPDIAQTIAVTCFGLGIACHLSGLHTLKIKETDRLEAMKTELSKFGARISVTDRALTLAPSDSILKNRTIDTYNDHRMAMAFGPLAMKTSLFINNYEVVSKSYPDFWEDLEKLGLKVKKL
ncbi:MAG: 3-phosphoshikimate 1-carboxyvinyltransferase [Maribacter sp.]|nr:3-phosphoshikimate 1-carboxyvinyltransferase [Maribacter sp.]